MKIAVVAHLKYPIADPFSGGLEMHTHLLADGLTARGHAVTLFAASGSNAASLRAICPPTSSLEADRTSAETIFSVEHDAYAVIMAQVREGNFDIVHCNALHYLPLRESSSLQVPMVAVLHTPPFDSLRAAVEAASGAVTFAAVSQSLKAQWAAISRPLTIIDNGIDLTRFPFATTPENPRFALWSGRIVPEKGLHLAIDAARLAKLPIRIAGPILDREYWEEYVAHRLGDDAAYLGHLTQVELAFVLGRASLLVCTPRWEEPFGLVVVEALSCGTPVAGFARGALPDLVDETCGKLVPADDIAALAGAIRRCCRLDRRACRNRAEDLFDCDLMIDRYEALYARLLSHPMSAGETELLDSADAV